MSKNPPTFKKPKKPNYLSTTNACKLCKPLGACLAFKGIEGAVPYLHGSQGCATYMRRYIISHYNEPIDIASSSLSEKHAVYGGGPNLKLGLNNVSAKYRPEIARKDYLADRKYWLDALKEAQNADERKLIRGQLKAIKEAIDHD